jgi:acyl phosphate:glycerol-3-phosphate acyltransferase
MLMYFAPIILGYLLGSVASAIVVCKLMGLKDPRTAGSGNPGATNVFRLHGKKAAAFTLLGDVLKGVLPVLIARAIGVHDFLIATTGLATFLGHLYPVFFGFRGGKGVATFIGILFASFWLLGLAFVGTWLFMAAVFRYSSLSAIVAAAMTPLYSWMLTSSQAYVLCFTAMSAVLIWRHRSNIRNLMAGTEEKIGVDKNTP